MIRFEDLRWDEYRTANRHPVAHMRLIHMPSGIVIERQHVEAWLPEYGAARKSMLAELAQKLEEMSK